jgi:hypothetical protein
VLERINGLRLCHQLFLKISGPKIRFANLEISWNRLETFCF